MKEKCENCRFWDYESKDGYVGEENNFSHCRRYPPQSDLRIVLKTLDDDAYECSMDWDFPDTEDWMWCGEYQPANLRATSEPPNPASSAAYERSRSSPATPEG